MHPDTFYEKWCTYISSLNLSYDLHDLRRTFITKALRLHHPRDVQMAVGHVSLTTTMGYAQDDRDTSDEVFKPEAG
jgi:integrase